MLESPVYFTPLAAALTSIQSFDMKLFQLFDDIVYLIPSAPCYQLKNDANPDIHNSKKMEQILSQLRPIEIEAFYYSIETSLAVVQAPPGTRDKLLASSVIQALGFYELEAPILLISNTSATLDEMLNILLAPGLFRKDDIGLLSGTDVYDLKSTLLSSQIQGELDILSKTLDNKLKSFSSALSESFSKLKTLNFFSDDIFPLILSQINDDQYKTLLTNAGYYISGLLQSTRWITDNIANLSKIGSSARMKIVKFIQNKGESQDIENSSDKTLTELVQVTVQVLKSWLPTRAQFYSMKQSSARVKLAADVIDSHFKTEDVGLYSSNFVEYMSKQRFSCQTYGDVNFLISSNVLEESLLSENKYLSFLSDKADDPKTLDHGSLWTMNPKKKFQMLFTILENGQIDAVQNLQKILHQIETLQSERVLLELKLRVHTLRKKKIIASTVDCASVHAELLIKAVSPKVMVILEAGKILEPSILALLQTGVEHLIMFGDHRREMPAVQTASLSSDHKFNITMMERLISGDYPHKVLSESLVKPQFLLGLHEVYPTINSIVGEPEECDSINLSKQIYFWDHSFPETKLSGSYKNEKEANMAVALALFLVQNGTPASKITILAPYHLQVQSIKSQYRILSERLVKTFASKELKRHPVICTPESFQGNDFTIMSLTRSYVDEGQRISVQSSTQKALCFIGNSAGLEKSNSCSNFLLKLKEEKSLNKTITIQCEKHPSVSHEVKSTIDPIAQKGAINNKTELMYHLYNPAELCESIVDFEIPGCKHIGRKKCSAKIDSTKKCSAPVEVSCNGKSLQHVHVVPCHNKSYGKRCTKPCDFVYENCSHKCEQVCGSPHFHTSNSCNATTTFLNPFGHLD